MPFWRYKYVTNSSKRSLCFNCSMFVNDSIEHMLFECDTLQDTREILWNDVINACPSVIFRQQLEAMEPWRRATYLISCLNYSYVVKWDKLINRILCFIHAMYEKKRSLIG